MANGIDDLRGMYSHYAAKKRIMDSLNQINAPSMSTIVGIMKTQGSLAKEEADLLLNDAVRSQDPARMREAKERILKIAETAPVPYRDVISTRADSMDTYIKAWDENKDFSGRLEDLRTQFDALDPYQQTDGRQSVLEAMIKNRNSITQYSTVYNKARQDAEEEKMQKDVASMGYIEYFDADPSTPEIDAPADVDPLQQGLYDRAELIRQSHYETGDYAGALSEFKKLTSTQHILEKAEDRYQKAKVTAEETLIKQGIKADEKILKVHNTNRKAFLKSEKADYLKRVKMYAADPSIGPAEAEKMAFNESVSGSAFTEPLETTGQPLVNSVDFLNVLHNNRDPFGEGRILDFEDYGTASQNTILAAEYEKEQDVRMGEIETNMSAVKGFLDAAHSYDDGEKYNIQVLGNFVASNSMENRPNFDARYALKMVDDRMMQMINDEDSSWGGVASPDFNWVGLDPLNRDDRNKIDTVVDDNYSEFSSQNKWYWNDMDDAQKNTYVSLYKAREHLYKLIDSGFLKMKMSDVQKQNTGGKLPSQPGI